MKLSLLRCLVALLLIVNINQILSVENNNYIDKRKISVCRVRNYQRLQIHYISVNGKKKPLQENPNKLSKPQIVIPKHYLSGMYPKENSVNSQEQRDKITYFDYGRKKDLEIIQQIRLDLSNLSNSYKNFKDLGFKPVVAAVVYDLLSNTENNIKKLSIEGETIRKPSLIYIINYETTRMQLLLLRKLIDNYKEIHQKILDEAREKNFIHDPQGIYLFYLNRMKTDMPKIFEEINCYMNVPVFNWEPENLLSTPVKLKGNISRTNLLNLTPEKSYCLNKKKTSFQRAGNNYTISPKINSFSKLSEIIKNKIES